MELFRSASWKSQCRGYDYFQQNKVLSFKQENDYEYSGIVKGSESKYNVYINIDKPRSNSSCNCAFAKDSKKICKHMVALYFTIFPKMANQFIREIEQAQEEYEEYRVTIDEKLQNYVKRMKKEELQEELLYCLYEVDWLYDKFIKNKIEL